MYVYVYVSEVWIKIKRLLINLKTKNNIIDKICLNSYGLLDLFSSPSFSKRARALLKRATWLSVLTTVTCVGDSFNGTAGSLKPSDRILFALWLKSSCGLDWKMFAMADTLEPPTRFFSSTVAMSSTQAYIKKNKSIFNTFIIITYDVFSFVL